MLLIPGGIITLIGLHLYLVVRLGVTSPPWSPDAAGKETADEAPAPLLQGLTRAGIPAAQGEPGGSE